MKQIAVIPDGDGIVSVRHNLGTEMGVEQVRVRCLRADGSGVGYRYFVPISTDELEVATVPGSGVTTVVVAPDNARQRVQA